MDWLQRPAEQAQKLLQAIKEAQEVLRNEGVQKRDVAVPVEIVTIERGNVSELRLEALPETPANFLQRSHANGNSHASRSSVDLANAIGEVCGRCRRG